MAAVVAAEALLVLVDIARGPWTVVGFEEGRNARAALQLACGHADRLLALQYRDFCGGCTAEAVVGAPLLRLLGPTVGVWKLVPALFHLGVVAAVAGLATRAAGPSGALRAGLLLAAAPFAYRELALTGWGNHVESGALALGALLLALAAGAVPRPGARLAAATGAGLLAGLGLWFCRTSAWVGLPLAAVGLAGIWRAPRGPGAVVLGGLALGTAAGLLPALQFYGARPSAWAAETQRMGALQPAAPGALLAWVGGDLGPGRLWPGAGDPVDALGMLAVGLTVVLGLAGLRRQPAVALGLAALGLAWALRADLWADQPPLSGFAPFHWRYRAPAWPLLVVGAASLPLSGAARGRRLATGALALVAVVGLGWRVAAWTGGPAPGRSAPLAPLRPVPDPTVPPGMPAQRHPLRQGRPVDLAAAQAWTAGHDDPLAACHAAHVVEQGRRAGLGLRGPGPVESAALQAWWAGLAADDRDAAATGLAWAVAPPGHDTDAAALAAARALAGPRLSLPLARRTGAGRAPDAETACAAAALAAAETATRGGRHTAPRPPPEYAPAIWSATLDAACPALGCGALSAGAPPGPG